MFSIGVFIDSGSKNKTPFCMGALHLLEGMVFMSTTNRSHFRVVCKVEAIGGNVVANSSSKQMCYTGNAIRAFMPEMVELLLDMVRNLLSNEWEVQEQWPRSRRRSFCCSEDGVHGWGLAAIRGLSVDPCCRGLRSSGGLYSAAISVGRGSFFLCRWSWEGTALSIVHAGFE